MTSLGEAHGHYARMIESILMESELVAPRYYMYKDHKKEGGWRPVVSGCASNTLGLSNMLSEIVESMCVAIEDPYEVISSTDMLSRIEEFNSWVAKEKILRRENWDWRSEYVLFGSDVKALFPSLSADRTSKLVREMAEKIDMDWVNLDDEWMRLYIHLNREMTSDIGEISHLLPKKRKYNL